MVKAWGVVIGQRPVWPETRVAGEADRASRAFLKAPCLITAVGGTHCRARGHRTLGLG